MFGKIWEWAGEFRQTQKNIGVNWQTIPVELKQLLEDVTYWVEHDTYPSDEIAYRFHHVTRKNTLFSKWKWSSR